MLISMVQLILKKIEKNIIADQFQKILTGYQIQTIQKNYQIPQETAKAWEGAHTSLLQENNLHIFKQISQQDENLYGRNLKPPHSMSTFHQQQLCPIKEQNDQKSLPKTLPSKDHITYYEKKYMNITMHMLVMGNNEKYEYTNSCAYTIQYLI